MIKINIIIFLKKNQIYKFIYFLLYKYKTIDLNIDFKFNNKINIIINNYLLLIK